MAKIDQRKYILLGAAFFLASVLDIIGVYALSVSMLYLGSNDEQQSRVNIFFESHFSALGSTDIFLLLMGLTILLFIAKSLTSIYLANLTLKHLSQVGEKISTNISSRFFNSNLASIRSLQSVKVSQGLNYGINALALELLGSYLILFGELFLVLLMATVLFLLSPSITILIIVYFSIIFIFVLRRMGRQIVLAGNIRIESDVAGNSLILNLVSGYRDIFVRGKVGRVLLEYSHKRKQSLEASAKLVLSGIVPKYVMELSLVIALGVIAVIGSFKLENQIDFVNSMIVFFAASSRLLPSILRIQTATNTIKTSERSSKFTIEILNLLENQECAEQNVQIYGREEKQKLNVNSQELIVARNIEFSYNENDFKISNLNFDISYGEFIAFVGRSGSGKSTIADLIIGLLKPTSGVLLVEGMSPQDYLRTQPGAIGLVPQSVELFNCSIAENVALFEDNPDYSRVQECLEQAHAMQFVEMLDDGIQSIVGERGLKLSGGQRQRIGIARALYTNPKILILDEATSSLDAESEKEISLSISSISKVTTTVVIAHRLSTVVSADRVFYLSSGNLIAAGTFEQIRKAIPEFAEQAKILKL